MIKGLLSDHSGTLDQLSQALLRLKSDFDSGLAVHTAVFSTRIQKDVKYLGV